MKRYTLTVVIEEGNDEFWDAIEASGKTGCDEVLECISEAIKQGGGWEADIKITNFEDK